MFIYKDAKSVTRKGTEKSTSIPWNIETNASSLPQTAVITGRVESMEVAPPEAIGASLPNTLYNNGVNNSTITSLIILDIRAIVPNCAATSAPA